MHIVSIHPTGERVPCWMRSTKTGVVRGFTLEEAATLRAQWREYANPDLRLEIHFANGEVLETKP